MPTSLKTELKHNPPAYIGCSGFSERLWKGFFYPDDLPSKEYLPYYAEHLKAVEVNSTFYRKPTQKTLANWHASTPKDFKFFIKIPKTISHIQKLSDSQAAVAEFCEHIATGLQEKLAGFLFQLPPSYAYSEENLQKLLAAVDSRYTNVVEFRQKDWWCEAVFATLKAANIVMAGVSFPPDKKQIPEAVVITSETQLYYRLHGNPVMFKSEYSESYLDELAAKIGDFTGTKFVFFNNTFGIAGIKNALYLDGVLNK